MRLTPSDYYSFYRPSKCPLRVWFRHNQIQETEPGPYEEVLRRLGIEHEKSHLATFPSFADISSGSLEDRASKTKEEVAKGTVVIYQPVIIASCNVDQTLCELIGEPDFLIKENGEYGIRDSKISRRITEKDHPEILLQLNLYGLLFQLAFGRPPERLEVHSGTGQIIGIPYSGETSVLEALKDVLAVKQSATAPYSPVGWTKCGGCGFYQKCWPEAEENKDVALVSGVDQGLATALNEIEITTAEGLLSNFDENTLGELQRPWGKKQQRVGKKAGSILQFAKSMITGEEFIFQTPAIPDHPNYVMFDLEGLPPHLDELEKIYLWGFQVFGADPTEYIAATADFGTSGDKSGWDAFLSCAENIFDRYGDLPFVHWHHYERVRIDLYVERYGDPKEIAARVRENLLDLLPITQKSIVLPLPSYSLKVIEQYIGFERTQEEYGGDWSMAKYIEATETEDKGLRDEVMDQILLYNREDLEATWAVLQWLRTKHA